MFSLHPQLEADTQPLGDLPHCRVLLMNHADFPWLILVPRGEAVAQNYYRELFDLPPEKYAQAMEEVRMVAGKFKAHTQADKMNIAALGNQVPQLHIHIIARFTQDKAWPNPVWNSGIPARKYDENHLKSYSCELRALLALP
ncbi:MAG: HIT family protein [Alphaproteobacteria bacterium]|nr:HIT family protein [Alphaproteobacteria bacterium]